MYSNIFCRVLSCQKLQFRRLPFPSTKLLSVNKYHQIFLLNNFSTDSKAISASSKMSKKGEPKVDLDKGTTPEEAVTMFATRNYKRADDDVSLPSIDDTEDKGVMNVKEKLNAMCTEMVRRDICALIVPSADAHQSEYVSRHDQRRAWVSGFTGSAGTAVIVYNETHGPEGLLWTDGRYFNQAEKELPKKWKLMKSGMPNVPTMEEYLRGCWDENIVAAATLAKKASERSPDEEPQKKKARTRKGILKLPMDSALMVDENEIVTIRIGFDPRHLSVKQWEELNQGLDGKIITTKKRKKLVGNIKAQIKLVPVMGVVDRVWGDFQPKLTGKSIFEHPDHFSGQATHEKIKALRKDMSTQGVDLMIISQLDDLAWAFNLRGMGFVPNCPVFYGYAFVTPTRCFLFCDMDLLNEGTAMAFLEAQEKHGLTIEMYDYTQFTETLEIFMTPTTRVWMSPKANYGVYEVCKKAIIEGKGDVSAQIVVKDCPVEAKKAVKNSVELENIKECHKYDGCAVVQYLHWLDKTVKVRKEYIFNEIQVAEKLEEFRARQPRYMGPSFDTISAMGPNGAVIHYKPTEKSTIKVTDESLYLCDSGAQYTNGTTDITRTLHFGKPSGLMVKYNTLVLEGHVQLAMTKFPENTQANRLDVIARAPLWKAGADYAHGTGHGIGAFLNVHESPPSMGGAAKPGEPPLQSGMVLSNEPGYYEDGRFGIRIENLMVVKDSAEMNENPNSKKKFLEFDTISFVPFQANLIDLKLLSTEAKQWVDSYHEKVLKEVGPILKSKPESAEAYEWLEAACKPLDEQQTGDASTADKEMEQWRVQQSLEKAEAEEKKIQDTA